MTLAKELNKNERNALSIFWLWIAWVEVAAISFLSFLVYHFFGLLEYYSYICGTILPFLRRWHSFLTTAGWWAYKYACQIPNNHFRQSPRSEHVSLSYLFWIATLTFSVKWIKRLVLIIKHLLNSHSLQKNPNTSGIPSVWAFIVVRFYMQTGTYLKYWKVLSQCSFLILFSCHADVAIVLS